MVIVFIYAHGDMLIPCMTSAPHIKVKAVDSRVECNCLHSFKNFHHQHIRDLCTRQLAMLMSQEFQPVRE